MTRLFGLTCVLWATVAFGEISPEMMDRFEKLEAETLQLRAEVARLQGTPGTSGTAVTPGTLVTPVTPDTLTRDEVPGYIEQRLESLRWRKGPVRVRPYGLFWVSMLGANSRFSPNDAVQFMLPEEAYGSDICTLTARRSRFGLAVDGVQVGWLGGMEMSGKAEIDFMGELGTVETKPSVLLREVYWQAENVCFTVLMGQARDVVSPLEPGLLNYYNAWGAGNLGYRSPQLRVSRRFCTGGGSQLEFQAAISHMCGADFPSIDHPGSYPAIQARLGWTLGRTYAAPAIEWGISGHFGDVRYDLPDGDTTIHTWSVNLDYRVPFTCRCGIQGEIFHGQGLAGMNGGVFQSIDTNLAGDGSQKSLHSTGGWAEFWWDWTECLTIRVGFGVDDPLDTDLTTASIRKNSVAYANMVYAFTPFLRTGFEYSYWRTLYRPGNPGGDKGSASVVEWMWQFEF